MSLYQIADLLVSMESTGMTLARALPYLASDSSGNAPDITISIQDKELPQYFAGVEMADDYRLYAATGSVFYTALAAHSGMLLHASCVVVDGLAYLFSAPCGTGKSTHARLWLKHFGKRAYILNDDKPALRVIDGEVYVYGTPWSGKYALNRNERVKLQGICLLQRAEHNSITKLPLQEAIVALLEQTTRRLPADSMTALLDSLQKIVLSCKVCLLKCNMDVEAAQVAYDYLSAPAD